MDDLIGRNGLLFLPQKEKPDYDGDIVVMPWALHIRIQHISNGHIDCNVQYAVDCEVVSASKRMAGLGVGLGQPEEGD